MIETKKPKTKEQKMKDIFLSVPKKKIKKQ